MQTAVIVSLKTTCLRVNIIDFSNSTISYFLSAYCMPGMALNLSSINMRGTSPKKGPELHFAHTWSHIQNCAVRADLHPVFLGLCRATVLCVSETSNSQCSDSISEQFFGNVNTDPLKVHLGHNFRLGGQGNLYVG